MKTRRCPGCGERGKLRDIVYGLPAGPPDEDVYVLGGCGVLGNDPNVRCIACRWEGWRENFPSVKEVAEGIWITPIIN